MELKGNKTVGTILLFILLFTPGVAYLYFADKIHWYISLMIAIFLFTLYFVLLVGGISTYIKIWRMKNYEKKW